MTAEEIERDPSLATEENLALLLESAIQVHSSEGADLGGYDWQLQSYYESLYTVNRNAESIEAIKAIAAHNPAAFSPRIRDLLEDIRRRRISELVTSSTLDSVTSHSGDFENLAEAEKGRERILNELEGILTLSRTE